MKTIKKNKDSLGDRMKMYENVTRFHLLPRSYVCIRVDGRSFHSYLKTCKRPFDKELMEDMNYTAIYLCENIQNAVVGFCQSDEISIITTNFTNFDTQMFFNGNIQKISSVIASMATSKFNQCRMLRYINDQSIELKNQQLAEFDCRCWNVPNRCEAYNTLLWRQQDCIRNSISMVAQSKFSHKELHGKSQANMQDMLRSININWATDFSDGEKNGRLITKESSLSFIVNQQERLILNRNKWESNGAWVFTKDEGRLLNMIPNYE